MQSEAVIRRRDLLSLIGAMAGSAAMYHAMTSLGFASESAYKGPLKLEGDPKGASVLVLGAGLAGMAAALELRKAGYKVQILEFNRRAGGRNWTLRGGDSFTELGGSHPEMRVRRRASISTLARGGFPITTARCSIIASGSGVALEPFIQLNHNAYLHATRAFGGKPQRIRDDQGGFPGPGLRAARQSDPAGQARRSRRQGRPGDAAARRYGSWGALDSDYNYNASLISAEFRGYAQRSRRRARRRAGAERSRWPAGHPEIAAVALSAEFRALRVPDHHVPAGRRHGHDRQGVCQAGRRPHPLQCQGDEDRAERPAASPSPLSTLRCAGAMQRPTPIGASALFRCRS